MLTSRNGDADDRGEDEDDVQSVIKPPQRRSRALRVLVFVGASPHRGAGRRDGGREETLIDVNLCERFVEEMHKNKMT